MTLQFANDSTYIPSHCAANLISQGSEPPCDIGHCDDFYSQPFFHQHCANEKQWYAPVPCFACLKKDANGNVIDSRYFPPDQIFTECAKLAALNQGWVGGQCFCCCSCLAKDTLIATATGLQKIGNLMEGDKISVGSRQSDSSSLIWAEVEVGFSAGTDTGVQPNAIYLGFDNDETPDLICTAAQVFLLSDGRYTTARKLRPGQELMRQDGTPQPISFISMGEYRGGVHHISTKLDWEDSPDGHLIVAAGVVVGDYVLQVNFDDLDKSLKEPEHDQLPNIGTPQYEDHHVNNIVRTDVSFEFAHPSSQAAQQESADTRSTLNGTFQTYTDTKQLIPAGAQSFLTQAQAEDLLKNSVQLPVSAPVPHDTFVTITKQLSGFYPDVQFSFDTTNFTPNIYAFEAYGKKNVVVTGGLARTQGFGYEGMMMAIGNAIGRFYGDKPKNARGYSSVGASDYFAFGVLSRNIWIGGSQWYAYCLAAYTQWKNLFDKITGEHAKGNAEFPLNDPSLECRILTVEQAIGGGSIPECAGGEPAPKLELEKAYLKDDGVKLIFSLGLDPGSLTDLTNFSFEPVAEVTNVSIGKDTKYVVNVKAKLEPATTYRVSVRNLISYLGSTLDVDHSSVTVEETAHVKS
jgi:hypothetical protein